MKEELVHKDYVYAGIRIHDDSKRAICIYPINEDGTLEKGRLFLWTKKSEGIVGQVYRGAKFSSVEAAGLEKSNWARNWHDVNQRLEWTMLDTEAMAVWNNLKLEKKNKDELEKLLLPLRVLLDGCKYDRAKRAAYLRQIELTLLTPPRVEEKCQNNPLSWKI